MEQNTEELNKVSIQKEVEDHLDQLKIARLACSQADTGFDFAVKHLSRSDIRSAFYRKNETQAHYMEVSEWLWTHTAHGFLFDDEAQIFKQEAMCCVRPQRSE